MQIQLWGGLIADVNLPLLLFVTFLIGFVPTMLYNHAIRWRLRQRLSTCERELLELRTPRPEPVARGARGSVCNVADHAARDACPHRAGAFRPTQTTILPPGCRHDEQPYLRRARHARSGTRQGSGDRASATMSAGSSSASNSSAAHGQPGVHAMAEFGLPIFLDLKLHDIPNTVAKAVQALGALEARDPYRPCEWRPGDAGRCQGGRAGRHQGDRCYHADEPGRLRSRGYRCGIGSAHDQVSRLDAACVRGGGRRHRLLRRGSRGGQGDLA